MRRLLKTISIAIVLTACSAGFVSCINNRMMTFEDGEFDSMEYNEELQLLNGEVEMDDVDR
ncbi:MAG: hypothetical protein II453_15600 [Alphaproteobacteria bacterium]|nr:hypothetical protein [Alphaproteobacteria bacterium]